MGKTGNLTQQQALEDQLRREFLLTLYQRDHRLLEVYQDGIIFNKMAQLVGAGIEAEQLGQWAKQIAGDDRWLVQRIINAAKYEESLQANG